VQKLIATEQEGEGGLGQCDSTSDGFRATQVKDVGIELGSTQDAGYEPVPQCASAVHERVH
jgi:hypothetical protein